MFTATTFNFDGASFTKEFSKRHDAKAHVGRAFKFSPKVQRVVVTSPLATLFELVRNETGELVSRVEAP